MACACKKQIVNPKSGEFNLTAHTGTTVQSDYFLPSPYYHNDEDDIERIMDQTMVHVSSYDHQVRHKYSIPVTSLTKENKKQSENFFKRLFKTMSSSIGSK